MATPLRPRRSLTPPHESLPTNPGAPGLASETWVSREPSASPPPTGRAGPLPTQTLPTNPGAPGLAYETWVSREPSASPPPNRPRRTPPHESLPTKSLPTNPGAPGLAYETWVSASPPPPPRAGPLPTNPSPQIRVPQVSLLRPGFPENPPPPLRQPAAKALSPAAQDPQTHTVS